MQIIRVGVDLAKEVFHVHGVNRKEEVVWRRKLRRSNWLKVVMEKLAPGAEVGMEACAGSHHWAREALRANIGETFSSLEISVEGGEVS